MKDTVVIVPICLKVKDIDVEKLLKLSLEDSKVMYCFSVSVDSKFLKCLKKIELKFSSNIKALCVYGATSNKELISTAYTFYLKKDSYKYFATTSFSKLNCTEYLFKAIDTLRRDDKLVVVFDRADQEVSILKKFNRFIIDLYSKYYLNFNLKEFSLKNNVMSRDLALYIYSKSFITNTFYELVLLNRFSRYIYSHLED